jgi:hypothetical protein
VPHSIYLSLYLSLEQPTTPRTQSAYGSNQQTCPCCRLWTSPVSSLVTVAVNARAAPACGGYRHPSALDFGGRILQVGRSPNRILAGHEKMIDMKRARDRLETQHTQAR